MSIRFTIHNGKPAIQWGEKGKKFTYKRKDPQSLVNAKMRARNEGKKIEYFKKLKGN